MDKPNTNIDDTFYSDSLAKLFDFVYEYWNKASEAGVKWGNYGWVPFLPQDSVINILASAKVPDTQKEADDYILGKIGDSFADVFCETQKNIEKLNANLMTFLEAVQSYESGLYTSCSLDLFAVIDSIFINSQAKPKSKANRKLSKNAVEDKYDESEKAPYFLAASAVKTIIDSLFKHAADFSPENEGIGNRNFISHGMNSIIPDKVFCIKLFVLLYNICVLFLSGIFSSEGE